MKKAGFLLAAALACAPCVNAEQVKGVEVYPAAKPAPEVAAQLAKKMNIKGASMYRTTDPVKKVAEFYRKQGLKELPGTDDRGGMFTKDKVNLTIQRPWMDMDTGKVVDDTLISIVPTNR